MVQTGIDAAAAAVSAAEAAASAASLSGTSTTSLLIEIGSKTFTTQAGETYPAGSWFTATSAANLANWMYGQVTSYSGTTLIGDVQVIGGSGTYADWNLSISAARGATGATGTGITELAVGWEAEGGTTPKTLTVDDDLTTAQAARRDAANTFTGPQNLARGSVAQHATTMDLWAQPNTVDGTGSAVTITAIANAPQAGASRFFYPIAATVLTHGATFDIDGNTNVTAATGDRWEFVAITTSTYRVHVVKNDGTAVVAGAAGLSAASQAQAEAGTADTVAITPLSANWHPGVAKAWVKCGVAADIVESHNITSVADSGTGYITVTIATDFASNGYAIICGYQLSANQVRVIKVDSAPAVGSFVLLSMDAANTLTDPQYYYIACFGDQ